MVNQVGLCITPPPRLNAATCNEQCGSPLYASSFDLAPPKRFGYGNGQFVFGYAASGSPTVVSFHI
jgi:hypothetical protein